MLNYKTVLVLLFVVVANLVASVFLLRLDVFVHGDLYAFGLVFSLDWADEYWHCNKILWTLLFGATVVAAMSIIPHYLHSKGASRFSKWAGFIYPALAFGFQALGIAYLYQINSLVWNRLPDYGVQTDVAWSVTYNCISMPALLLLVIALLALILPAIRALDIIEVRIVQEDE